MKKSEYLGNMVFPLRHAVLKEWPQGDIRQLWSDNPELYSTAFGQTDVFHRVLGGHNGLDVATFEGDEVVACQFGEVVAVVLDPTHVGGNQVFINSPVLDDNGTPVIVKHVYAHLKDVLVSKGQQVAKGQLIGHEGNTGFVTSGTEQFWGNAPAGLGVHLHFGMYELINRSGAWVTRYDIVMGTFDPLPWFTDPDPNDDKIEGNYKGTLSLLARLAEYLKGFVR